MLYVSFAGLGLGLDTAGLDYNTADLYHIAANKGLRYMLTVADPWGRWERWLTVRGTEK